MVEIADDVTFRGHLQKQSDNYDSHGDSANAQDVYNEILEIMSNTVDKWDVTSIPTLICRQRNHTGREHL